MNTKRLPTKLFVLFAVAATAWFAAAAMDAEEPAARPAEKPAAAESRSVAQLAKQARESIVVITSAGRDSGNRGVGTGFVVAADGLIATNLHVIGDARPIGVQLADGAKLEVTDVHASDRFQDLAVLRVNTAGKSLRPMPLADVAEIAEGAPIVMMGNPHGLKHSVVAGVVSGRREIDGRGMLQLAVPIEPGNSGGPVLDEQGRVLGVATMKSAVTENLGFAVEVAALRKLLDKPNPIPMSRWLTIGVIDPRRWQPLFGANWRQRAGRILVDGTGAGFGGRSLCLSRQAVPDPPFEIAVSVKLDDEAGAAGLVFHSDEGDQHYGFYPSNGRLRLSCFRGPTVFMWEVLKELPSDAYRPGEWNELKVRVEPDKFLCFVNGTQVIESTDRSFTSGKVGLAKFRETAAEFKNFRVGPPVEAAPGHDPAALARLAESLQQLPPALELRDEQLDPLVAAADASAALVLERAKALEKQAKDLRQLATDVQTRRTVRELTDLLEKQPDDFDLLRAALLVARLDNAELDVDGYLREVERMADEIKAGMKSIADAEEPAKIAALNKFLFAENGFHGSRFDYYHRANSYLDRVIDDREGLPITLSVLYIELGRRLGLAIEGVGLPGHFVVRHVPKDGPPQLIDVYEGGLPMTRDDAAKRVLESSGQPIRDEHLAAMPRRDILARMVNNLIGLAERDGDKPALLRYVETQVTIQPQSIQHRGMRAVLRYQLGRRDAAIADLDWIIEQAPEGLDLDPIRQMRETFLTQPPP